MYAMGVVQAPGILNYAMASPQTSHGPNPIALKMTTDPPHPTGALGSGARHDVPGIARPARGRAAAPRAPHSTPAVCASGTRAVSGPGAGLVLEAHAHCVMRAELGDPTSRRHLATPVWPLADKGGWGRS